MNISSAAATVTVPANLALALSTTNGPASLLIFFSRSYTMMMILIYLSESFIYYSSVFLKITLYYLFIIFSLLFVVEVTTLRAE